MQSHSKEDKMAFHLEVCIACLLIPYHIGDSRSGRGASHYPQPGCTQYRILAAVIDT